MRRPSLRSQLNQIRLWVRQGRTDAWIAHKLDISVEQLEQFKRDHALDDQPAPPAPTEAWDAEPDEVIEEAPLEEPEEEDELEGPLVSERSAADDGDREDDEAARGRRRRRGRRGRRRTTRSTTFEATFEHGGEGYGLWLDPAVADDPVYEEHWAGHRDVEVTLESDAIVIRRSDRSASDG